MGTWKKVDIRDLHEVLDMKDEVLAIRRQVRVEREVTNRRSTSFEVRDGHLVVVGR